MTIRDIESGAIQYRAAVKIEDIKDHEVYVRAVPYGKPTDIGGGITEDFEPGAFAKAASAPHRISFFADHGGPLIGRGTEFEDRADGPYIRFKLGRHDAAQQALLMMEDGLYQDVSVEFRALPDYMTVRRDGDRIRVSHRRAHLTGVAAVPEGAYAEEALILSARDAKQEREQEKARAWLEAFKRADPFSR